MRKSQFTFLVEICDLGHLWALEIATPKGIFQNSAKILHLPLDNRLAIGSPTHSYRISIDFHQTTNIITYKVSIPPMAGHGGQMFCCLHTHSRPFQPGQSPTPEPCAREHNSLLRFSSLLTVAPPEASVLFHSHCKENEKFMQIQLHAQCPSSGSSGFL